MAKVALIDTNYIKQNSAASKHIDDETISNAIIVAQEKHLKGALSTALYNDIQTQVEIYLTAGTAISSAYTTLINDFIKPCLLHYSLYEGLGMLHFNITNIGVQERRSEWSNPPSIVGLTNLKNSILSTAEFYKGELTNYLYANMTDTYTLFQTSTGKSDDKYNQNDYFCGIHL